MGSRLSCLRGKHGSIHEKRNIFLSLGKEKSIQRRSSNAKKALLGLKNLIERSVCTCQLKIKIYLQKSGCTTTTTRKKKNKSSLKRECCACMSLEKRSSFTNGLFKMKSILLSGAGGTGGDHGGSKGNNTSNGGGVDDQKKPK